jgi:hypothetical protein
LPTCLDHEDAHVNEDDAHDHGDDGKEEGRTRRGRRWPSNS